ncbi:MAG: hypothetical protein QM489_01690 [Candidatus Izemoplasma sp.]
MTKNDKFLKSYGTEEAIKMSFILFNLNLLFIFFMDDVLVLIIILTLINFSYITACLLYLKATYNNKPNNAFSYVVKVLFPVALFYHQYKGLKNQVVFLNGNFFKSYSLLFNIESKKNQVSESDCIKSYLTTVKVVEINTVNKESLKLFSQLEKLLNKYFKYYLLPSIMSILVIIGLTFKYYSFISQSFLFVFVVIILVVNLSEYLIIEVVELIRIKTALKNKDYYVVIMKFYLHYLRLFVIYDNKNAIELNDTLIDYLDG